jgi:hypothetical protein
MARGYRKMKNLQKVEIPQLAREIPRSMFFACTSLTYAQLPQSIEKIGAYAFADCKALENFTSFSYMKIKKIGTSAFENCVCIEQADFPEELEFLGGAAFAGCIGLKRVTFAEKCELKVISDHCFHGCKLLERIELPDLVEKVGVSAFSGCDSLRYISIPESCEQEPGIEELMNRSDVKVEVRALEENEKIGEEINEEICDEA